MSQAPFFDFEGHEDEALLSPLASSTSTPQASTATPTSRKKQLRWDDVLRFQLVQHAIVVQPWDGRPRECTFAIGVDLIYSVVLSIV